MTILCRTTYGDLPGIRPCTHRNEHKITCRDHPGYTRNPGTCTGCLPRKADRGFLCERHFEMVEATYTNWERFVRLAQESDGRVVSAAEDGIRGPAADGHANLTLTFLAIDECTRHLASMPDGAHALEEWISTEDGARDAILFANAATTAYRSLEVEEKPRTIPAVRCNACGYRNLVWHPTEYFHDVVEVVCSHCGHQIDQDRLERFNPPTPPRRSESCADDTHTACQSLECRCDCHQRTVSLYTIQTPAHLLRREAS